MKLFGLIAVVLIAFSACQKENLRPDCPSKRAPESVEFTETAPQPEANALSLSGKPENTGTGGSGTTGTGNDDNNGGGIVDPNADQDASNSVSKAPKKGR